MNYLRQEYTARVNRVIDYIEANISQDLSLKELADVAHFSPYHFHRIFRAMVGETLNDFIQRVRIERAASKLVQNPGQTVTEIAFECGFSGSSAFAREFRNVFGMSASSWRAKTTLNTAISAKRIARTAKQSAISGKTPSSPSSTLKV
jgi:AraC family transcriptional regulator